MMSKRVALLIGVSRYGYGYDPLPGVERDVEEMERVLRERGEFTVEYPLLNPEAQQMRERIERFFASSSSKDDVLLLYFSGHGALDRHVGRDLFLSTCQTYKEGNQLVESSAVEARFVHNHMQNSKSRKIIVILDCCFSGAFANLLKKGEASVDFDIFKVRGSVVLASSSPNEVSYQPQETSLNERPLSVYTRFLIEGMEGLAQQQQCEWIVADDLHQYASRKIQTEYPAATLPKIIVAEEQGYQLPIVRAPQADPHTKYRKIVDELLRELDRKSNFNFDGEIDLNSLNSRYLDAERNRLGVSIEDAATILAEIQTPFRARAKKREDYAAAVRMALQEEYPFRDRTLEKLKRIQDSLSLTDADARFIEARLLPKTYLLSNFVLLLSCVRHTLLRMNLLYPLGFSVTVVVIGVVFFIQQKPCQIGEHKSLLWCEPYKNFDDVLKEDSVNITQSFRAGGSTAIAALSRKLTYRLRDRYDYVDVGKNKDVDTGKNEEVVAWSRRGIEKLLDSDELDISFSSRNLAEEEKYKASQKNIRLEAIPVAKDGLAFFVHPNQRIGELTLEQIKSIYTEKDTNGQALSIPLNSFKPFTPDPTDNVKPYEYFQQEILKDRYGNNVKVKKTPSQLIDLLKNELTGISFASTSNVCTQQNSIKPLNIKKGSELYPPCDGDQPNRNAISNNTYPLTRTLYVVIRRDGGETEKKGIAFVNLLLSNEGQKLLDEAGYIPLRKVP